MSTQGRCRCGAILRFPDGPQGMKTRCAVCGAVVRLRVGLRRRSRRQRRHSGDTEQEAADLEKAVDLRRVQMAYGLNAPIPNIEQGIAQEYGEREQLVIDREKPRSIIGTPERVTERMLALQEQFQADELVVLTVAGSYRARLRSYELLADAFQLGR